MPTAVAERQASTPTSTPARAIAAWMAHQRVREPNHQKSAPPARPDDPEREVQRDRAVGVDRPHRGDQAEGAADGVEHGQEHHGGAAVGVHGVILPLVGPFGADRARVTPRSGQSPVSSVGTVMTSTIAPRRYTVIGSGRPIASANSSRCRLCASATGRRSGLQHQVAGLQPGAVGGGAGDDVDDPQPPPPAGALGQRRPAAAPGVLTSPR